MGEKTEKPANEAVLFLHKAELNQILGINPRTGGRLLWQVVFEGDLAERIGLDYDEFKKIKTFRGSRALEIRKELELM